MDKKQATLTLAKELDKANKIKVIENGSLQRYIVENSICALPLGEGGEEWKVKDSAGMGHYSDFSREYDDLNSKLVGELETRARNAGANYVFTTTSHSQALYEDVYSSGGQLGCVIYAVPFAIITEDDEEILRDFYKGEPPPEAAEAADVLGLDLEVDFRSLYEKEPEKFKEYFPVLSEEKQEKILREVVVTLENEELEKWLTKEFPDLSEKTASEMVTSEDE